ncbi:MAG: Crp/Fnr family transcriptional regulator [Deltaproteobacteria bacterium]|nr:Crp/Fnr family transcriptional regulator [Deltaproteobacteria bacterium]
MAEVDKKHRPQREEYGGLFPFLTGELTDFFERTAGRIEFDKGEMLYEHGFPCPFVPFIISGLVRVFKIGEYGREITLYRVRPGGVCILSSTCSLTERQFPAIAEAEEPTVAYVISGAIFRKSIKAHPSLQEYLLDVMSERLVGMMDVLEDVAFSRVDLRLATMLLRETSPPHAPVLETTHARLATELGSAREVVSRILKDFERKGLVKLRRGQVVVVSRKSLTDFRGELENRAS